MLLKTDACREEIYRNLMVCHKYLGSKSDVRHVYQRCCKVLSSIMGSTPSGETISLYNAIMSEKIKTLPIKSLKGAD
jgi:DNA-binding SARP family transcriptional activator